MVDSLGDRMKQYEDREALRSGMPRLPIVIRLDGRSFHTFTRGMAKPFDHALVAMMEEVAKFVLDELQAKIAYVQSDEISVLLPVESPLFNGRLQKLASVSAGLASGKLMQLLPQYFPARVGKVQCFDSRAWNVPSLDEAANALLWRERDATKNSISMLAQSLFSHKELQHKDGRMMQQMMLTQKDVNWNDLADNLKRGSFFRKEKVTMESTTYGSYQRTKIQRVDMPPFGTVINRVDVCYNGAEPMADYFVQPEEEADND